MDARPISIDYEFQGTLILGERRYEWNHVVHIEGGNYEGSGLGPGSGSFRVDDTLTYPTGGRRLAGEVSQDLGPPVVGAPIHPLTHQPAHVASASGYITGTETSGGETRTLQTGYMVIIVLVPKTPEGTAQIPVYGMVDDEVKAPTGDSYAELKVNGLVRDPEDLEGQRLGTATVTWRTR